MSTGHEGSMSTIHAENPFSMVNVRIPILYSMNSDTNFSERSIAMQVSEAVHIICQIRRYPDGNRRISTISEVTGVSEDGKVMLETVFEYDPAAGIFRAVGYVPEKIIEKIRNRGLEFDEGIFLADEMGNVTDVREKNKKIEKDEKDKKNNGSHNEDTPDKS